jgi:hypothetical protein
MEKIPSPFSFNGETETNHLQCKICGIEIIKYDNEYFHIHTGKVRGGMDHEPDPEPVYISTRRRLANFHTRGMRSMIGSGQVTGHETPDYIQDGECEGVYDLDQDHGLTADERNDNGRF